MAETDIKCVKLKSDRRSIYRMNEFLWDSLLSASEEKKVADLSRGETGKSAVSCRGDVTGLSGLVADVTGKSA